VTLAMIFLFFAGQPVAKVAIVGITLSSLGESARPRRRGVGRRELHGRSGRRLARSGLSRDRFRRYHALARHDDRRRQPAPFRFLPTRWRRQRCTILAAGAVVALVVAPISGALSDRSQHRRGRRWLFLIAGVLGSCVGLSLLLPFGPGVSLWLYAAAFIFLQFWWNWVAGAYAGLIPDVMAEHEQGRASAWLNILSVSGTVAGNFVVAATYKTGNPSGTIAAFVTLNIAILVVMLRYVREPQPATQRSAFVLGEFLRLFYVDPCVHANFYWVLVTRLLGNMGIWSVFTFLLFYFKDVIGVAEPAQVLPALLGIGAVLAVPASVIGVRLAARHGLVRLTQVTSWIMAICALYFALIAFYPGLALIVPVMLIYAAAFGAYQAVAWALALKVLPSAEAEGHGYLAHLYGAAADPGAGSHGMDDIGGEGILRRSHCPRDSIRDRSALAHALVHSRHLCAAACPCWKSNPNGDRAAELGEQSPKRRCCIRSVRFCRST
jgi:Major Facilitator Superfamily